MSHSNPSQASMPIFVKGRKRKREYVPSNRTPMQPQSTDQTNSGSGGDIDLADFSLRRMPRSPEDEPPLPKYRRVETKLNMNRSFVHMEELDSSESIINGQPIPGGSLPQEPKPTILSLNNRNPQLSNGVIVIDDSSGEDVVASHSKGLSEKQAPLHLQNSCNEYFFQRLGFTKSDFLKDTFIQELKERFERRREKSDIMCSKLMQTIEELQSARKAHDRAMLQRISQFQFAKCPINLVDSVKELKPFTDKH
ncbi:hypothetical protein KR032_002612 [Drosophila birchii]|nr:hypothetical protein KR032_002612 [Drosophila birchii]